MARDKRSKPSNVVRSRSASLLGGLSSGRQKEDLPSNRFIELGDIALGNAKHRVANFPMTTIEVAPEKLPEIDILAEPLFKPKRTQRPEQQAPRPKRTGVAGLLARGNPPRPNMVAPKTSLPPKPLRPKPPNIRRPKPITNRPR